MKKILLSLLLTLSIVASFAQPGNTNYYRTRVRYYNTMSDSLLGMPKDTFNLHSQYALNSGWNNYVWFASKGDITYMWSIAQQRWIATNIPLVSNITVINDSTIQICNNNGCDTISFNINTSVVITNVSIVNDSTVLVCNSAGSCDTVVFHITQPPITTVTIINDSTIQICNAGGCDTLVVNNPTPPITTVTVINDSTIQICNAGGCDTITIHSPPTVTIINDSTIMVCNTLGCDTIVVGPSVNVTIINDSTVQICGSNVSGPELITNGGFVGNTTGWELGALWNYGSNNIVHSFGSVQATAQAGGLVEGGSYRVSADIGGTVGTVDIKLDAGTAHTYTAGAGSVTFNGTWNNANNYKIVFLPSNDFNGSVTNVSVKQILPNCDTIQIQPTFFLDTVHIFVEPPLHARNDSTFYMTRSTKADSGFLANDDFTYFWHKTDSIFTHPSQSGVDSFFYTNGDTTNLWYLNDVLANGIISGGQVIYSGTPYVYNITPAVYRLNGIRYVSPATQITIDSANASLPRTDVFYVDTSGNAGYLPGIAANPNLKPSIDVSWQLELTSIDLTPANPPAIVDSTIYNENVAPEWIPVTNAGTTSDPNNLLNPWIGAKSVQVTNINAGDYIRFTHAGGTFDLSTFLSNNGSLTGFILLKQAIPSSAFLRAQWFNGGTAVSPLTVIPVIKNNTTTYQGFSIPLSSFSFTGNIVTHLQIQYTNTTATNYNGFFIDDINLQSGIPPTPNGGNALIRVTRNTGTDSVMGTYQDGTVSYQFRDSSGTAGAVITADNGLSKNTPTNVQLGGTLTKLDSIQAAAFALKMFGTAVPLQVYATGSTAVYGQTNNAFGVYGAATSSGGTGVYGNMSSTAGYGVLGQTVAGSYGLGSQVAGSTNNAVVPVIDVYATPTGTAAVGLGGSIDFNIVSDNGSKRLANQIISQWTDAVDATRTARLDITGIYQGAGQTIASFAGTAASGGVGIGTTPSANVKLSVTGTSTNGGIQVNIANGFGVLVNAIGSNIGVQSYSQDGTALYGVTAGTNSSVSKVMLLSKTPLTAVSLGVGGEIEMDLTTSVQPRLSNEIIWKWTDITDATRTSQMLITGVNSAVTGNIVAIDGTGVVGIGRFASFGATRLHIVDNAMTGSLPQVEISSSSNVSGQLLRVDATGASMQGIQASTVNNTALIGLASGSGAGLSAVSTTGTAGIIQANSASATGLVTSGGLAASMSAFNATQTNVIPIIQLGRSFAGSTALDGGGGSIDINIITDNTANNRLANSIVSKWIDHIDATRTSQLSIKGVNSAATGDIIFFEGNGRTRFNGRAQFLQGANVTAANDLTLGLDGNQFTITGNTQINAITTANWQAGSEIILIFTGTPTVKNNTAGGAGTAVILLAGGVDFAATANDVLTLVWNGTSFFEKSRSVN